MSLATRNAFIVFIFYLFTLMFSSSCATLVNGNKIKKVGQQSESKPQKRLHKRDQIQYDRFKRNDEDRDVGFLWW